MEVIFFLLGGALVKMVSALKSKIRIIYEVD